METPSAALPSDAGIQPEGHSSVHAQVKKHLNGQLRALSL